MQLKINFTMTGFNKTGGTIVLANIMNRLIERGHKVSITSIKGRFDLVSPSVQHITAKGLNIKASWYCSRALSAFFRRLLKHEIYINTYRDLDILESIMPECDINVATYHLTAFPVFRSKKGVPFYHMQHYEVLFSTDPHRRALVEETYYLPLNKIANSVWLKNQLKDNHSIDCPVINPGIDHSIFKVRCDKNRKKKRVVTYGSNADWKGFKDALEAMKIVFKKYKNIEWIVFGLSPLKYWDDSAPYQFIQGIYNENLAELYSSAHVVICPSWFESFPLPPLEAMACGAPVVTTRYGTEDYCFHEENSLIIPPKNPQLIADAVLRLLTDEDLNRKLSHRGIETAKKFTWERTIDKLEDLYKKALSNKR